MKKYDKYSKLPSPVATQNGKMVLTTCAIQSCCIKCCFAIFYRIFHPPVNERMYWLTRLWLIISSLELVQFAATNNPNTHQQYTFYERQSICLKLHTISRNNVSGNLFHICFSINILHEYHLLLTHKNVTIFLFFFVNKSFFFSIFFILKVWRKDIASLR